MLALFAAALLPLWLFKYLPGMDLGNHVAIASILWKLLTGSDGAVASHYVLNPQPVPYYVVYAVLAPCVGAFGPYLGLKVALSALAVATFAGAWRLFRALGCPWWTPLAGVLFFYGASFFWGFLPSQAGIPFILFGAAGLASHLAGGSARSLAVAAVAGLLASLSHIGLMVPWGAFLVAWLLAAGLRRTWRAGALMALASIVVPLAPALVSWALGASSPEARLALGYGTLAELLDRLRMHLAIFDRGLGRAAHVAFLISTLVLLVLPSGRSVEPSVRRFVRLALPLQAIAYLATPLAAHVGGSAIWGLNFRFFPFVEAAFVALLAGRQLSGRLRLVALAPALCIALELGALLSLGRAFDGTARLFNPVLAAMRPGATLAVATRQERWAPAWPPVFTSLHGYSVATGAGYDSSVFDEKQTPIRHVRSLRGDARLDRPTVGEFDYLLIQQISATDPPIPAPEDGELTVTSGPWRLYRRRAPAN
ncbi:MAG: hypothetical protein QM765_05735 [Myxococcales bacterium]